MEPCCLVEIGHDLNFLLSHRSHRSLGHFLAIDVPLGLEQRLDDVLRATTHGQHALGLGDASEQAHLFELFEDGFARVKSLHARKLGATLARDQALVVDDGYELKIQTFAHLEIVGVVSGRHFDGARAKRHVHHCVG